MNKKHTLMFLLLSLILISLSCVYAQNDTHNTIESVSDENLLENTDSNNYNDANHITKNHQDSTKEDYSQTHYINNSEELSNILSTAENLTGKHILELNDKELIINNDFYIFNDDLELTFNGNGNQLTLQSSLSFSVKNITFNDVIIEFDDDSESRDLIDNYGNMYLNNVIIKNTKEYNKMVNLLKENDFYDFNDFDGVAKIFEYSTRTMNLNNKGTLFVNNSQFINNSGNGGTSIYNDGKMIVENTVFEDSLGEYGIIYSNNNFIIKNCEFKNNRVFQQLILAHANSELINTTFSNNIIAGSSILDNRGSIKVKDCEFTNNSVKYELVDNWDYMDASNLKLINNTCEILINSFGNLTLNDSFIKDNTCTRAIICRDTLYDNQTDDIYKTGTVTLTGNKIFRGNVEYTDFLNNRDTGVLSLYNNTIFDKPDYQGECVFDANTFIADKNLYDEEGNYHGQRKEMEIQNHINYEIIVLKRPVKTIITIDPIAERNKLGEEIIISGTLTDINNNPLSNENISIIIDKRNHYDRENVLVEYVSTDDNGKYNYTYITDSVGTQIIEVYRFSSPLYTSAQNNTTTVIVDSEYEEAILTLDPIYKTLFYGDTLLISGSLTDINNNPLTDKTICISIEGGEDDFGIYSYTFNTTTDENGRYSYQHELNNRGTMDILVYFENDNIYGYLDKRSNSYVDDLVTIISLDYIPSSINLGEDINISGNLTDLNNVTLANQTLTINLTYEDSGKSVLKNVTTDDNGKYALNFTPQISGKLNIIACSFTFRADKWGYANITILDNGNVNMNNETSDNNITDVNETNNNKTDDNRSTQNEEKTDNPTKTNNYSRQKTYLKTHKILKSNKIQKNTVNKSISKLSDRIILKVDTNVTLSWLNDIFKDDFKNKTLLIYIDDILVFNGTTSDNPSEILFKVLKEYTGEHSLKVIVDDNSYQKVVNII